MEWLSRSALVLALIAITLLSLLPVPAPPVEGIDKAEHLFAYLTLAALADFSFSRSGFSWRKWLPLFVYGVLMEFLQDQLPHRYFSVNDMIANGAGLLLYGLLLTRLPGYRRLKRGAPDRAVATPRAPGRQSDRR
jgi:VanZ family protein